jgi:hypothetical protein
MICEYATEMTSTVTAVASASATARYVCAPSARNASSGPYADDDSPSAPRPTQARSAIERDAMERAGILDVARFAEHEAFQVGRHPRSRIRGGSDARDVADVRSYRKLVNAAAPLR